MPASLLTKGMTLVRVERMQPFLDRYLDQEAAWLLGVGFSEGFRIPCSPGLCSTSDPELVFGLATSCSGF